MQLREWRKSNGLTLEQLAERVDVSITQLSRIEKGKSSPSVAAADRIAAVTGGAISAAELLGLMSAAPVKGMQEDRGGFRFDTSGISSQLHEEAIFYGLDPDVIARKAIEEAVKAERIRRWNEENREAIESWNRHYEKHGLWNDKYRLF